MKDVPEDPTRTFLSVFVIDAKSNLLDCKMLLNNCLLSNGFFESIGVLKTEILFWDVFESQVIIKTQAGEIICLNQLFTTLFVQCK